LRCFDARGWVQLQTTAVENGREEVVCRWFSPVRSPSTAGEWDIILRNYSGTRAGFSDRTCYVRLTDVAKAKLTEQGIAKVLSAAGPPGRVRRIALWILNNMAALIVAVIGGVMLVLVLRWLDLG